jgi:hypothetical protein
VSRAGIAARLTDTLRNGITPQQALHQQRGNGCAALMRLAAYLQCAGIQTQLGPRCSQKAPLTAQGVALRVKRRAHLAGIDPANLSGHSLRSGFITTAARHGASIWKLADQSRR